MKKTGLLLFLLSSILYSCSTYTCPTYARKAPDNTQVKEVREKNI